MTPQKENWIESMMNSLDGIRQAEPSPFLFHKIMQRAGEQPVYEISPKLIWLAAASFALLVALNIGAIKNGSSPAGSETAPMKVLAAQYQLLSASEINYN